MYIRLSDNYYPLSEREIRDAFPNTSFPQPFNPDGYAVVFPVPQPTYDQYAQRVQEAAPVLTDKGHYEQAWLVVDLTGDELLAAQERKVADIAAAKVSKWEAIKAERDRRTQTGGYPAAGKWFHSDTFSRTQILALVMLGANIPAGLMWKTMDGTFSTMDAAVANQVFAAAAMQDTATFQAAETHKAAMEASADPAAYDFSTGWPAVFGE